MSVFIFSQQRDRQMMINILAILFMPFWCF